MIPPPLLVALGGMAADALAVALSMFLARLWVYTIRRMREALR